MDTVHQRLSWLLALCLNKLLANVFTRAFAEESMGSKYVEATRLEFVKLYEESSPSTPIFFILSPGVDPLKDVEKLGTHLSSFFLFFFFSSVTCLFSWFSLLPGLKLGFTIDQGTLHNVSLGQGQEEVAERLVKSASKCGHWVILQVSSSNRPLMGLMISSQPHAQERLTQFGSIESIIG